MQLKTDKKQKEVKSHGCFEFPVFISQEVLSRYERGAFNWHWHPEIEITLILEGRISYQVNDQTYLLSSGDGLFCNANALHAGHMIDGEDCYYLSTTFHPRIIYGFEGSVLQRKYVNPIVTNPSIGSLVLREETGWQKEVLKNLHQIYQLYLESSVSFEMKVSQLLGTVWLSIYDHLDIKRIQSTQSTDSVRDIERLRAILSYIQEHYSDKITLSDIADEIHLCKSECCRFFKKYMDVSLFDYLMYYRIEKSLPLLARDSLSITEIAQRSGFSSPGYFARVFRQQINCSPSAYRRNSKGEKSI